MARIKVCGVTSLEDALLAVGLGADAVGFVFAPSPRRVSPEAVRDIVAHLPPLVTKVGVFVNAPLNEIREIMEYCGLDLAQLHGEEPPELCAALFPRAIKAFRVKDESVLDLIPRYRAPAFLLEGYSSAGYGGVGCGFDWSLARRASSLGRLILSGGLNPENVARAVREVRPYAVDVSSGVEREPGKKSPEKLRAFILACREAADGPA